MKDTKKKNKNIPTAQNKPHDGSGVFTQGFE